jgi:hypothetical protein
MEPVLEPRAPGSVAIQPTGVSKSAASWSAIIAGAFVAAGVSLVLLALGSGLGFAAVSPWHDRGISTASFAVTTAIWFIVIQWLSSAVGGYIAGRLRTRWLGTNPHEVFFRDTAHGLITWAVATVVVASLLISAFGSGVRAAARVGAGGVHAVAASETPSYLYGMDRLFRASDVTAAVAQNGNDGRLEVQHAIAQAMTTDGAVSDADRTYLASLVAAKTGVSNEEAQKRLNDFITSANEAKGKLEAAADAARKAAAKGAIFLALAMAIGAFIASLSAALGGRLRDEHP